LSTNHTEFLYNFIKDRNIKVFAEIGLWKSRTTRKILKVCHGNLDEYWAVDQFALLDKKHGRMGKRTQDDWDSLYRYACGLMTWFPKLHTVRMTSLEAANLFKGRRYFDLVYIDASHFYEDVKQDIQAWLTTIKSGMFLAGHDYIVRRSAHKGVKKAVDEMFGKDVFVMCEGEVWMVKVP
jgi:hypothetical protein